jgi:hypothetical protein
MTQLALPLDWPAAETESDFIVTPANADAVRHLGHWSLWPVMATVLTGPRKSGRSFLGRIFAARSGATLFDGGERADEEQLFHAWNRALAERRPLLIIADTPCSQWDIALPDLRSRLAATPHVAIGEPDDLLIPALLERLLAARAVSINADVPDWIARRIERTYVAVHRAVDALDQAAWATRRRIGIAVARDALIRSNVIEDSRVFE